MEIKEYYIYDSNIYFFTDYFENSTNLSDYLKENVIITELKAKIIVKQIAEYLTFCHNRSFVHLNLHPNNIIFINANCNKLKVRKITITI